MRRLEKEDKREKKKKRRGREEKKTKKKKMKKEEADAEEEERRRMEHKLPSLATTNRLIESMSNRIDEVISFLGIRLSVQLSVSVYSTGYRYVLLSFFENASNQPSVI